MPSPPTPGSSFLPSMLPVLKAQTRVIFLSRLSLSISPYTHSFSPIHKSTTHRSIELLWAALQSGVHFAHSSCDMSRQNFWLIPSLNTHSSPSLWTCLLRLLSFKHGDSGSHPWHATFSHLAYLIYHCHTNFSSSASLWSACLPMCPLQWACQSYHCLLLGAL